MPRAIDISDLPQPVIEAIEALIRAHRERAPRHAEPRRAVGWATGILPELPAAFFEPLPPEVLDQFEGKAA
jgi:hypothetical protein